MSQKHCPSNKPIEIIVSKVIAHATVCMGKYTLISASMLEQVEKGTSVWRVGGLLRWILY